jgi:hypothetical protein
MKTRRPWILYLIIFGYLLFAFNGFLRGGQALADWSLLRDAGLRPGPAYLVMTGIVYGLSGLAVALGLWIGWSKAGRLGRGLAFFYFAWFWIDKMLISQNAAARSNWPFMLLLSAVILGLALGGLWLRPVRQYLGEIS